MSRRRRPSSSSYAARRSTVPVPAAAASASGIATVTDTPNEDDEEEEFQRHDDDDHHRHHHHQQQQQQQQPPSRRPRPRPVKEDENRVGGAVAMSSNDESSTAPQMTEEEEVATTMTVAEEAEAEEATVATAAASRRRSTTARSRSMTSLPPTASSSSSSAAAAAATVGVEREDIDDDPNVHAQLVGTFKPGTIRRIRLENFSTYDYVDFQPGPRFNVVCGPNGTGKSTILNAICLGLGGEPKILGRADDARLFVSHGKDKGKIEITLEPSQSRRNRDIDDDHGNNNTTTSSSRNNNNNNNTIFCRVIDVNKGSANGNGRASSDFFINGVQVTGQRVREVVLELYHIRVENLCTFLPQDRVGHFSGFSSSQLLAETLSCMTGSSRHLPKMHDALRALERDYRRGDTDLAALRESLHHVERDHARLERERERMEQRQSALAERDLLHQKLVWLQYDSIREECLELNAEKKRTKALWEQSSETSVVPLREQYEELRNTLERHQTKVQALSGTIEKAREDTERQRAKFDKHHEEVENQLAELNSCDSERSQRERALEEHRERVESYRQRVEDHVSVEEAEEAHRAAHASYATEAQPAYREAQKRVSAVAMERTEAEQDLQVAQVKLQQLQDEKTQRRLRVFSRNPNLGKIWEWLRSHHDEFRRPIHGPIAIEVVLKSNNAAAYLEQHVPNSTLFSFVAELKEDYDKLYKRIREEMNVPISIILIENGQLKPLPHREYREEFYDMLQRDHGVRGYLDESFEAPPAIMQALRDAAQVDKVLVGDERTQRSIDECNLLDLLSRPRDPRDDANPKNRRGSCIFAAKGSRSFKYTTTISRYAPYGASKRVDDIDPARFLSQGANPDHKRRAEEEMEAARSRREEVEGRVRDLQSAVDETVKVAQEAKSESDQAKKVLDQARALRTKLASARQKLRRLEAEAAEGVETAASKKRGLIQRIQKRMESAIAALEAHADGHASIMEHTVASAGSMLTRDVAHSNALRTKSMLDNAEQEYRALEEAAKVAQRNYKEASSRLKEAKKKAEGLAPLQDESGNDLPLKAELEALPVQTVEETAAAVEEADRRAQAIDANPDVMRQYEEQTERLRQLRAELTDHQDNKDVKVKEINDLAERFSATLTNSRNKVDALFSEYMAELGCAGSVRLDTGDYKPENDREPRHGNFDQWGLEIQVSFRNKSNLEVLSAQRQSGGERSVSTIMYLMALQELMVSPFRCVDEINQGLDDRNERLVFRRIVKNSTRPPTNPSDPTSHCGQYFLITPKLLPNLTDMENEAVTVHIIKNGPLNYMKQGQFAGDVLLEALEAAAGRKRSPPPAPAPSPRKRQQQQHDDHDGGDNNNEDEVNEDDRMKEEEQDRGVPNGDDNGDNDSDNRRRPRTKKRRVTQSSRRSRASS